MGLFGQQGVTPRVRRVPLLAARLVPGLLLLAVSMIPAPASAQTVAPYIPASLYPVAAHITFDANFSDSRMDAAWNLDAGGEPLMHTLPQRDFLRQSGWMEQGFLNRNGQVAWFILFDSAYGRFADGQQGNLTAYADLRLMLTKWWRARLTTHQPSDIFPPGIDGITETRTISAESGGPFLVLSAWWGSAREVEAIAFAAPQLMHRSLLRRMLAAQVRYAVRFDQDAAKSSGAGKVARMRSST